MLNHVKCIILCWWLNYHYHYRGEQCSSNLFSIYHGFEHSKSTAADLIHATVFFLIYWNCCDCLFRFHCLPKFYSIWLLINAHLESILVSIKISFCSFLVFHSHHICDKKFKPKSPETDSILKEVVCSFQR